MNMMFWQFSNIFDDVLCDMFDNYKRFYANDIEFEHYCEGLYNRFVLDSSFVVHFENTCRFRYNGLCDTGFAYELN